MPDLAAYEGFLTGTLLRLPGVTDIRNNFAIQTVKAHGPLPVERLAEAGGPDAMPVARRP
ncbi:hypothetical protein ACM26W_04095 [Halomonas sp. HK25]|uniref:hypothetical protein n=1 Tax=Halomonas sp. HK25 TaxID=3394321 RepID=UPI0039FD8D0C